VPVYGASAMEMNRLRWRARRGLLENDLLLTRFLDKTGPLDETRQRGLINELLDLLLARAEPAGELDRDDVRAVLQDIRNS
jgi:antitoxin CptB